VVGLVMLLHGLGRILEEFTALQRLEWMTFDWRVRQATNTPAQNAGNLGFVFINNDTIEEVASIGRGTFMDTSSRSSRRRERKPRPSTSFFQNFAVTTPPCRTALRAHRTNTLPAP
jgi:hypothetical protein